MAEESWLDKIANVIDTADRIRKGAEKVKDVALQVKGAGERWSSRKAAGLCPLCGETPALGVMFCEKDLGKIAAYGLKHADVDAVKDFFGKR